MSDRMKHLLEMAAGLVLALVIGLALHSFIGRHQVKDHATQADALGTQAAIQEGKANAYLEQIQAQKQVIADHDAKAKDSDAKLARLKADLAEARRIALQPPTDPSAPAPAYPDLRPVVERQDRLIAEYEARDKEKDQRIAERDRLLESMDKALKARTLEADAYKQQAIQEHSARVAAEGVAKSERWLGRIEGFAVGLGSGYIAGRLK